MTASEAGPKVNRIPTFATYEEEATYWDTHDLTDFWDKFEPVKLNVTGPLIEAVTVHMSPVTVRQLTAIAQSHGLDTEALIHVWLLERLEVEDELRFGRAPLESDNDPIPP